MQFLLSIIFANYVESLPTGGLTGRWSQAYAVRKLCTEFHSTDLCCQDAFSSPAMDAMFLTPLMFLVPTAHPSVLGPRPVQSIKALCEAVERPDSRHGQYLGHHVCIFDCQDIRSDSWMSYMPTEEELLDPILLMRVRLRPRQVRTVERFLMVCPKGYQSAIGPRMSRWAGARTRVVAFCFLPGLNPKRAREDVQIPSTSSKRSKSMHWTADEMAAVVAFITALAPTADLQTQ